MRLLHPHFSAWHYPLGTFDNFQLNYQERQDELGLNWDSFKYRNYDYAIGRFMSVDPLAEKYAYNGVYNFSENRVLDARELEGLESILLLDIDHRPNDNGTAGTTYTAQIYYRDDDTGQINGPYQGSSYPNSVSLTDNSPAANTLDAGEHHYNNESGHHGGRSKGLNIEDFGNRQTTGTTPNGDKTTMQYVNVHEGYSDNGGPRSRGSLGCITIKPDDAEGFFNNFSWTNDRATTGDSSGTISVNRGDNTSNSIKLTEFQIEAQHIKLDNMRIEMLENETSQQNQELLDKLKQTNE